MLPSGIARVDLGSGKTTRFDFAPEQYCIEPNFAPEPQAARGDAEPGWILTIVNDGAAAAAELVVLDAEHLADGPIATVGLPQTTPFNFHGWCSAAS